MAVEEKEKGGEEEIGSTGSFRVHHPLSIRSFLSETSSPRKRNTGSTGETRGKGEFNFLVGKGKQTRLIYDRDRNVKIFALYFTREQVRVGRVTNGGSRIGFGGWKRFRLGLKF